MVSDLEVLLHVPVAVVAEEDVVQPRYVAADGDQKHDDEPEPEEEEDLLVEEIDGQHALDRVALQILELPDLKVTERDAWEAWGRNAQLPVVNQSGEKIEPVHVEIHGEEGVQQEELGDGVDTVKELDEHVKPREESPLPLGQPEAEDVGETLSQTYQEVVVVLPVRQQPPVYVLGDVHDGAVAVFGFSQLSVL